MILFIVVIFSVICNVFSSSSVTNVRDTSHELAVLKRDKRWLVWKEGINWVAIIFGIGIPFEVDGQSIVLGTAVKAYYTLPDNSSYFLHPELSYERKRRTVSRWNIYAFIEEFLEHNHYTDGKGCLLKSICQISAIKLEERSGLFAEIVHNILTPSSTNENVEDHSNYDYHFAEKVGREVGTCDHIFPECSVDPIQQFTRIMTSNKYIS